MEITITEVNQGQRCKCKAEEEVGKVCLRMVKLLVEVTKELGSLDVPINSLDTLILKI